MSKTAEEHLIEHAYVSEADMVHEESKHVFKAMHEFAAQEVAKELGAFKANLKIAIDDHFMGSKEEMSANWAGRKIIKIIDTVK